MATQLLTVIVDWLIYLEGGTYSAIFGYFPSQFLNCMIKIIP